MKYYLFSSFDGMLLKCKKNKDTDKNNKVIAKNYEMKLENFSKYRYLTLKAKSSN